MFGRLWESFTKFFILTLVPKFTWRLRSKYRLTEDELDFIRSSLAKDHYIIMTRRRNYFSAYLTHLGHFLLTGKWGYWSHVLINAEGEVDTDEDFRLIEAIKPGVTYSPFENVFDVSSVALLKPTHMSIDEWTDALDKAHKLIGRPYDTLFNVFDDSKMSCVEVVRKALQATPNYSTNFANFEKMIARRRNLTPQMFYDCPDFEVVYEVRK